MIWHKYKQYLLPITLSASGIWLLLRIYFGGASILVPENTDVMILAAVLVVAIIAAIHTLVHISMQHLRHLSVQRVRHETLAEHSRFLRRLDHELKNPLTALRAGLRTLGLTSLDEQQRQVVETLEVEALRLSQLVADLRKIAELEVQPLNLQPIHLETFVANIVQAENGRFAGGQRTLISYLDSADTVWIADEDLLLLAVHNLLDNAFKYTQAGDKVCLNVYTQQALIIQVSDNGIGISSDDLPHIWEELYRAVQKEKIPGSGIGLSLVKAIAERHNGGVEIASKPGYGTTVSMYVPPAS